MSGLIQVIKGGEAVENIAQAAAPSATVHPWIRASDGPEGGYIPPNTVAHVMTITVTASETPQANSTSQQVWTVSNCRHQADHHGGLPDSCQCDGYTSALPTMSGTSACAYSTFTAVPGLTSTTSISAPVKAATISPAVNSMNFTMFTSALTSAGPKPTLSPPPSTKSVSAGPRMEKVAVSMVVLCSLQILWLLMDVC